MDPAFQSEYRFEGRKLVLKEEKAKASKKKDAKKTKTKKDS